MRSNGYPVLLRAGLAAGLMLVGVSGASAWERLGFASYGGSGNYGGASVYTTAGYGFGGYPPAGGYYGDGLGFVPRPVDLVPPAWGYGAYGVPSATGIRQAPSARPVVYVIDRPATRRPGARSRVLSRDTSGGWSDPHGSEAVSGGARVVSVTVPRR